MKRIFVALAVLCMLPLATAVDTGGTVGIDISVEEFPPLIWMCDSRAVIDDDVEPGRIDGEPVCSVKEFNEIEVGDFTDGTCAPECCNSWKCTGTDTECKANGAPSCKEDPLQTGCQCKNKQWQGCILKGSKLVERHNNYAFEGEQLEWIVLVMDKNKIEQVDEVAATIGSMQGTGNDVEVECVRLAGYAGLGDTLEPSCNARIGEEELETFDPQTMAYYECTLTVETPESMYGEYWVNVEACSGLDCAIADENEYWFLNPVVALGIDDADGDGIISFGDSVDGVRPGTVAYSETLLISNDDDPTYGSSGVMLDMFITGTDFYDPASSGARCIISNRLVLGDNYAVSTNDGPDGVSTNKCNIGFGDGDDHFCYYAVNGAYSTLDDDRSDDEGYAPIVYGDQFTTALYNDAELIQANRNGAYWHANLLPPGAEMSLTLKMGLPEPCVGDFSDGSIYFWGEAV